VGHPLRPEKHKAGWIVATPWVDPNASALSIGELAQKSCLRLGEVRLAACGRCILLGPATPIGKSWIILGHSERRSYARREQSVDRREYFHLAVAGAAGAVLPARSLAAEEQSARAVRGLPSALIKDIKVITTQPSGVRLVVVKIITNQDGLYGYGCATFTQRADLVVPSVEKYLKPLLLGKPTDRIEDTWQACYNSSYWRNGGVLNNAISGVDQALWDIKGRQAHMPVYQLLGGKVREAVATYATVGGMEVPEVIDGARRAMQDGFKHIKVQIGVPGMAAYAVGIGSQPVKGLHPGAVFEPGPYMRRTRQMLEACREQLGEEIELIHDVHERVSPHQAVQFAKELEPIRLFYLEDALPPEHINYFRQIRQQCATSLWASCSTTLTSGSR
jgi:mannonate dehydratase